MDFLRAQALASRLITANGRNTTLQKLSATAANPSEPWKGPGTPTVTETKDLKMAFVPATGSELGKYFVDDELLKTCEQVALVAGVEGSDLTIYQRVVDGVKLWKIEWVRELKPADTVVLYAFGLKL